MPSFFGKQAIRLLRRKWKSPQLLAEELYTMFQGDEPLETDNPIIINNNTDSPPITIRDFGDGDFIIKIQRGGDTIGGIGEDPSGRPEFKDKDGDPVPPTIITEQTGGGGIPGKVIAQDSGKFYLVDLYENGPLQDATRRVRVLQLQIHADDVIPADTWTIVTSQKLTDSGGTTEFFSMQVPVWL